MAKQDSENQNSDYAVEGVDPEVEAKIDAMMNIDKPKNPASEGKKLKIVVNDADEKPSEENTDLTGAPLLPDEKLPDFESDKKTEKTEKKDESNAENTEKPDTKNEEFVEVEKTSAEPVEEASELTETAEDTIAADEIISEEEAEYEPAAETEKPEIILKDEIGVEDRATEAAVDEIIAEESDRILAVEDAKAELAKDGLTANKKSFFDKIKAKLKEFWANPLARRMTIGSLMLAIIVVLAVPTSRYFALNLAGVRASTSLRVVDEKTGQPLKNVEVSMSDKTGTTDIDGQVKLEKIKLGNQVLTAKKPAFADLEQKVTIGWGSNPKGELNLTAIGSRYVFEVKDFLSGQPIDAEAVSGYKYSARSDDKGEIVLVVEDENIENIDIEIVSDNYRIEKLNLPVGSKDVQKLQLVPARKHAFVSKRDGQYDLYKIDADGKNEKLVLKGTGKEGEENMVILPHKNKDLIAFISTRGDKYNEDGYPLSSLHIIDLNSNEATKVTVSERIQLIDFIDDKLIYVSIKAGQSAASPNRHQLVSYDIEKAEEKSLASSNYFNDVLSARGVIYYSPAEYKVNGQVGFYQIKPDGSDKYTIFGEEVWNLFRVNYFKVNASVGQDWYEYDIGNAQFDKLEGAPAVLKSRVYADAPDSPHSIWVDERDGKGVLLLYNSETNEDDKALITKGGLRNPIRWLDNDHIVYRVFDNSETADYVISISGGEPKKIIDVTNIAGLDRWYYY